MDAQNIDGTMGTYHPHTDVTLMEGLPRGMKARRLCLPTFRNISVGETSSSRLQERNFFFNYRRFKHPYDSKIKGVYGNKRPFIIDAREKKNCI